MTTVEELKNKLITANAMFVESDGVISIPTSQGFIRVYADSQEWQLNHGVKHKNIDKLLKIMQINERVTLVGS